ncbi:hypothetical protein K1W54_04940 [Micromonospora sp. CPCC 205371]|nr:hypothetical protein [Micromonospora sp. CPCC 205371]
MSTELVGPVAVVRFRDGTVIPYQPPRDTVDGERWSNCTDHRVACDCREAELAEQIGEYRATLEAAVKACQRILDGHATYAYEDAPDGGQREVGCMCTGCQIARKVHLLASYEAGPTYRDEIDGLSPESVDAGWRWKLCAPYLAERFPGICQTAWTRSRADGHAHLMQPGGVPEPIEVEVPF